MRIRSSHRKDATAPRRARFSGPVAALAATTLALGSVVAISTSAAAAVPSTFEIDGNQITNSTIDWQTADPDVVPDPIGNNDTTTFAGSDKEDPNNPAQGWPNWSPGNPGTNSGKSDLGNVLVYSEIAEDMGDYTQWLHLAWDRDGDSGSVNYFIELNQKDNLDMMNPDRTVGDIRIVVEEDGNSGFTCIGVDTWDGSDWSDRQGCSGDLSDVAVNSESILDYFNSPNADENDMISADRFVEASLNLTDLGIGSLCPAAGFTTLNMRTQTGEAAGSALKDLATGEIDVPSLCSDLTIFKEDEDGEPLPGATFTISPNPNGGDDPFEFTMGSGSFTFPEIGQDLWGTEFTITEIEAPEGYLLPAERSQTITVGPAESASVTFTDPKPWEPLEIDVTAEQFVTRTWENDKQVDGDDVLLLPADQESVELDYVVEVSWSDTMLDQGGRTVEVTVDNPNDEPVTGNLSVDLNGDFCQYMGTDLDEWENAFASGETVLSVECPNPPLNGEVDATVTWDRGVYPQTQEDVDDPENAPQGEASDSTMIITTDNGLPAVDVWDDFTNPDLPPTYLGMVEATQDAGSEEFPVSQVIEVPLGECIEVTNDGYIVEVEAGADGDRIDSATEVVEVCREAPADLTIYKVDEEEQPLPGAVFTISPNPMDPEGEDPLEFTTGENGMYTFSDVVYFGEYTVTEIQAPEGYFLPAERSQTVTLATGDDKALTFVDPLIWEPLEIDVTAEQFVTRTWANDKEADATRIDLRADEPSATINYTVEVMESDTFLDPDADPARAVTVTVDNPNADPVTGMLTVELDGEFCTLEGTDLDMWENEFASGMNEFMVVCDDPPLYGEVEATVTWDRGDYPQTQDDVDDPENAPPGEASDSVELEEVTTDNGVTAVDVWDDFTNPDLEPEYLQTVTSTGEATTTTIEFSKEFEVAQGECIDVDNTAYIVKTEAGADGERIDEDDATVEICRDAPAELKIVKAAQKLHEDDDDVWLPGATFEIMPNPLDPESEDPLVVVTGEDGTYTIEQIADFGEYTVTETAAPEGYLLPPPSERERTVELLEGETTEVYFVDPLQWEPLDIEVMGKGEQFVSRTFTVDKEAETHPVKLPADQARTTVEFMVQVVEGPTTLDDATLQASVEVSNPNDNPVMATVAATFEEEACVIDAEDADEAMDGIQFWFPSGESLMTLTCENVNDFEGVLAATVTWDLGEYPQTQEQVDDPENAGEGSASDAVDIDPTVVDNGPTSVEVWDDFTTPDLAPTMLGTVKAKKPGAVTEFPVSTTVTVEQGKCLDVTNEAYILAGDTELDRDSASVEVCRDVPVTPPPTPPLPRTGADMAMAALAALLLIGTGAGIMFVRRRNQG
ncbi:prealbumin-like fold domain-containing protein [Isoptericola sp. b515]|uniref:prealbumin-like fold domain-containing protein n=1 Tax=Isoptericola sp. b515 TaxID=3064652 RepID=UPI002713FBDF|nr:prealbumin-like fold domain-containing protein [Isoptericola sp. b515]MDO8148178.1 prealbumin-like fold domain-containing protein [Isoptericola sp. b515]